MRPSLAVLLVCLCFPPAAAEASTVRFVSNAELIARSDRVVHGRVIAQRAVRAKPGARSIRTVTTIEIIEDFTGASGETVEVSELGGTMAGESMHVGGGVEFAVGAEVVLCLRQGPQGLHAIGMGLSKFDLERAANGERRLVRRLRDTMVVGGPSTAGDLSLREFRDLARKVRGRPSRREGTADLPVTRIPLEPQAFTFFDGNASAASPSPRWIEADSGAPVRYFTNSHFANPNAQPPVPQNILAASLDAALAAWTNPPEASLILENGGTTRQQFSEGPWLTIPSNSVVISFEDPDDEIDDPVLALTMVFIVDYAGGILRGVRFHGISDAAIKFQNAAALPAAFRQQQDFTRVLGHEIGHTIGLGHTQDTLPNATSNLMNWVCCYSSQPVPPALGPDDRAGLAFLYPSSSNTPSNLPSLTLDRRSLNFGVLTSGATFPPRTSAQIIRLTQGGAGTATWSAVPSDPWLQVSPESGSGTAVLTISVNPAVGLPQSGMVSGYVDLTYTGATTTSDRIGVNLRLIPNGTSAPAVGYVDTPLENVTGLRGAVPFTGWALDDIEIASVSVCRAAVVGEAPPVPDPKGPCGGWAHIYVGDAVFIDGARPDVAVGYPTYPRNTQAGWGLMVLTNVLPGQPVGNGTYAFSMWARDVEGRSTLLGTRTVTVDNASADLPFGTIDTPAQGQTIGGSTYANFGWVLSRVRRADPAGGGSVIVSVDGVPLGSPGGWSARDDISKLFPGYSGVENALGVFGLDTRLFSNGLHTIQWTATDTSGKTEGLGSRYFSVSNGSAATRRTDGAASAVMAAVEPATLTSMPVTTRPVRGRRGWAPDAPWRTYPADAAGGIVVYGEELDRFELQLGGRGAGPVTGYLRVGSALGPLPIGSRLEAATGVFTWAPGVGFVGAYDLVFVRGTGAAPVARQEVRIVLRPKGTGPQVVIDTPVVRQAVGQPFVVAGWAADLTAAEGSGIDTLHVWAYPLAGTAPVFLGATGVGGHRPDVSAAYGEQFGASGYGLLVQGLEPGTYDLAVFGWSQQRSDFLPASVVRIAVR